VRVHLTEKIDLSLLGETSGFSLSTGESILPDTEILVQGVVKAEDATPLTKLRAVIIPWAGLPGATKTSFESRPEVSVYNLHHNAGMTAETAIALMMAVSRNVVTLDRRMRMRDWGERSKGIKQPFSWRDFVRKKLLHGGRDWTESYDGAGTVGLAGKTAVILGFGEIGQRVATVCSALGMKVIGIRRGSDRIIDRFEVWNIGRLDEALRHADVLHICLPLTDETKRILTAQKFALMPDHAIVVNVGRGVIIDEPALFAEVKSKRFHGAGLDVWWRYPGENATRDCAPGNFDWANLENVVMTPHIGGSGAGVDELRWRAVADVLRRLQSGDFETGRVDLDSGF